MTLIQIQWVSIISALLEQALQNIVWNSLNYTPAGSEINIRVFRRHGRINLLVKDNGPGVGEDELPYIFNKFYRTKQAPPPAGRASALRSPKRSSKLMTVRSPPATGKKAA